MRGRLSVSPGHAASSKWTTIHALVRNKRIGILALQETHLTPPLVDDIHNLFGRRLLVINSPNPTNPTSSAGVAFVLNREVTSISDLQIREIIPGHALLLTTSWHNSTSLSVLNVYAPNDYHQQAAFWETLEDYWSTHTLPKPDFMMGDFNLVEDPIDHSPPRLDPQAPSAALRDLRPSIVPTDHNLTTVKYSPLTAPFIGTGRWTWPMGLLHDDKLLSAIVDLGLQLEKDLANLASARSPEANAQRLWAHWKERVRTLCRQHAKVTLAKINNKITALERDLTRSLNDPSMDMSDEAQKTLLEHPTLWPSSVGRQRGPTNQVCCNCPPRQKTP
ncbi:hypothetical protein OE88DRAFT_1711212 [Heliocybe sulcata]|uniref:Endonuclease/exonuclease/phosphatase domain-containing protein n=1 Tax=Heliocybe sulcata TaxID=5364 RepID=A0A5C3NE86_9AGAM|nr:hypothetical protein OE88DRAFT_1711212 [Heliocybe sulcata]